MEQEEEKNIIIEFQRKVLQEANCTAEMLAYLDEIDDDVFREYYCICALDGMTVEEIRRIDNIAVQDWRVKIKHIKEERLNFLENIFVPNGEAEKETLSYEFTFEDEETTVEFTKTSLTDGKEIEGAKLKVTDESGNTVDEWTSGKEPHIIKELTVGKKYTMTETLPADGYVTAESITFTVEDTGEVQKVEMKDDVTKVQISKTDISGKELPGAKLTILDKDGKTVESWTSEEKPHYIEMLPIGEYTLREETAPDGYLVAEDVKFTVKDTGEIQKVVMKDEVKPTETPTETPAETPETTSTPETKDTETTKTSTSPKTGDNTPILFWILLAGVGMAGVGGTVILRKKKKK